MEYVADVVEWAPDVAGAVADMAEVADEADEADEADWIHIRRITVPVAVVLKPQTVRSKSESLPKPMAMAVSKPRSMIQGPSSGPRSLR